MHQNGHGGPSISSWKSPPNIGRRWIWPSSSTDRKYQKWCLWGTKMLKQYQVGLKSTTNTYWCVIPPIVWCPKMSNNVLIGCLSKVSTVHRHCLAVNGRCLAVIFIKKYFDPWFGFCASEVPLHITVETVHPLGYHFKISLKHPNILIYFQVLNWPVHFHRFSEKYKFLHEKQIFGR